MATPIYFAVQYTSAEEVTQVLTDVGFELRNEPAPTEPGIDWWCNKATGRVQFYFERRYNLQQFAADLALNPFVRDVSTVFAAYYFAGRGGECVNETLTTQYEEAKELLEEIKNMTADIPGFSPDDEKGTTPVVSGLAVDMQAVPALRVDLTRSTGRPAGYPLRLWYPGAYWGAN